MTSSAEARPAEAGMTWVAGEQLGRSLVSRPWIERLWSSVADRGRPYAHVLAASVAPLERARQLAIALLSERGEASGAAVARELHAVLRDLGPEDRLAFYRFLADELPAARRVGSGRRRRPTSPTPRPSAPPSSPRRPSRPGRSCCAG